MRCRKGKKPHNRVSPESGRRLTHHRIAIFFSGATLLASFANVISYGLTQIADDPERDGWKWIFIVQGAITIGIAIVCYIILPDLPDTKRNKFLTTEEREVVKARLTAERGDAEGGKITWQVVKDVFMMWHVWSV